MKKFGGALLTWIALAGCDGAPRKDDPVEAENSGIECALEGAKLFERTCTVEEMSGDDGAVLIVGRANVGYRRLQIATDGRGVVSADGSWGSITPCWGSSMACRTAGRSVATRTMPVTMAMAKSVVVWARPMTSANWPWMTPPMG